MASKPKIAAVVGTLCEAYNRHPTALTFKAYEIALSHVSDDDLDAATTRLLCSPSGFMPTPGQLRQAAVTGGATFEARADIAWHEFDRAVSMEGSDHSVTFDDGIINATVRLLGGWIHCCEKCGDDYFVWLKKSFKETYVRLCNSGRISEELRRPLTGRTEIANSQFPDRILGKLNAYTGETLRIGTSQPVLAPPVDGSDRRERIADGGPKTIGDVVKQLTDQSGDQGGAA
jgi:hypothetical protein